MNLPGAQDSRCSGRKSPLGESVVEKFLYCCCTGLFGITFPVTLQRESPDPETVEVILITQAAPMKCQF